MRATVRQCTSCGRQDDHERWSSMDAASSAGALTSAWTCPFCGGVEPELAERIGDGDSARGGEATGLDANLAELPEDPDERRRAVESTLPLSHP